MNRQAILDNVALIAGGAATATAGIYSGAGKITTADGKSVAVAYSSLRAVPDLQVDDFVHVCLVDETIKSGSAFTVWTHRIRMQLLVSVSRSDLRTATRLLEAFVPAYFDAFALKLTLNGTAAVSEIVNVRGPIGVEPLYPERHALEFVMEAVEKAGVAYAA